MTLLSGLEVELVLRVLRPARSASPVRPATSRPIASAISTIALTMRSTMITLMKASCSPPIRPSSAQRRRR